MALADTARLIASLELQDKFSRPLSGANRSLSGFERNMGGATRATRGLGVAGVAVGTAIGTLGAALLHRGFTTFIGAVAGGVESLNRLESAEVATATVIESTGGVAGISARQVRDLAEEYENLNATIDDKVIQAGENLLLTFTNIREDAFEPALEAALNLNEALHGGEEGLQGNIILLGKALNDPIRGLARLTRVGVDFDEQQRAQIKSLVENNDLLGAQQVILAELGEEFGGQFAAAGETAAGSQAKLADKIEDVQAALAGPLIPVIDRVRSKLIDLLDSPRVLAGAEALGDAIAGLFTDENLEAGVALIERGIDALSTADFSGVGGTFSSIFESLANLPWQAIGDAAQLLGTGARALLTAFTSLPPWVQTAVLTGWGLNKLTGGVLGDIVGQLASGLIRGILGITAGVVHINAATVTGAGGVPTGPAKGAGGAGAAGALATILKNAIKVGVAAAILEEAGPGQVESDLRAEELATLLRNQGGTLEQAQVALNANLGVLQILASDAELLRGLTDEQLEALNTKVAQLGPVPEALANLVDGVVVKNTSALADAFGNKLTTVKLKFDPSDLPRGTKEREGGAGRTEVPDTAVPGRAREGTHGAVLPDTALAPVTTAIGEVEAEVTALEPILEKGSAATKAAIKTGSAGIMNRVNQSIGVLGTTSAATKAAISSGSTGIMNRVNQEITATTGVKGAVAQYGAAQLTKQAAIAAAVYNNTAVLKTKDFAPKIKVTTNVTSNVTISEIQRKITSQQISTSVATGGGGFAV